MISAVLCAAFSILLVFISIPHQNDSARVPEQWITCPKPNGAGQGDQWTAGLFVKRYSTVGARRYLMRLRVAWAASALPRSDSASAS